MKTLLVEDNPMDVRLIREMLKELPAGTLQLQQVGHLDSAMERLRQETFDVVLLDLGLPDAQGMETLTLIQKASRGVPIVVLTSFDDERFALEAVRAGAQDYLVKAQFDSQLLVRTIRYAVQRKQAEEEVRRLNAELEQRVVERTAQLQTANQVLLKEIADRKQAEEALRRAESELRALIENVPAMVFIALPGGSNAYVSRGWREYTGLSAEDTQGFGWQAVIHPEDLERHMEKWRVCSATGEPYEDEARYHRAADGEYRWFLNRAVPLRDETGNILKWYGVLTDIEDRKRAEALIAGEKRVLELVAKGDPLPEILGSLCRLVEEQASGALASILLVEGDRLKHGAAPSLPKAYTDAIDGVLIGPSAGSCGTAAYRGQQVIVEDIAADPLWANYRDAALPHSLHACWSTPVFSSQGKVIATVAMYYREPRGPSASDQEIIEQITHLAGVAIERKLTYDQLKRSQAYLAEAQKLTRTGSWAYAPARKKTLYWSEEIFRIFGLDPQQGIPHYDETKRLVHPDDLARVSEECLKGFLEKAQFSQDYRLLLRDGTLKHLHVIWHPVLDKGGELVEYVGTAADVTERKRAEEKIREQEIELRHILDLTPQFVGVFGPDRRRLYANRSALTYFGVTLEQWQDIPDHFHFFHPDDRERVTTETDNMFLSGAAHEFEARLRKDDGSYRWFLIRYNPLRDEQGRIMRWYLAGTDIEDRKRAEERLRNENVALREEIDKASMFEEIVGTSPVLQTVLSLISKVASTDSSVLIIGETGTGKELVARAIHRRSHRSTRAFVSVNCAAIPRDLIASELFGHEKGAFTGATQRRLGRFELAEGGTIFLDEIGELHAETQIALLRVLQEHEFERVGGTRSIQTNVRVIAATNRDLQTAIAAGTFRSDLFFRLNVFPIEIPPLRARKEDIPLLIEYFIYRYSRKAGKSIRRVDKKSLELLQSYPWPGNIRELQNVIERSVIVCESESFSVDESWLSWQPLATAVTSPLDLSEKLAAQEKEMIEAALSESGGRVSGPSGAAAKLGMPRSTLESKIRLLNINKNRFKTAVPSKNN